MPNYQIKVSPEALQDIQEATDWYNEQLAGLGIRFQKQTVKQITKLKSTALLYNIRYGNVRCMLIKKFPFMAHFTLDIDHYTVTVFAVFHTSRNPKIWNKRR